MPLAKIVVNVALSQEKKAAFIPKVSKALAKLTGKPEAYVMVTLVVGDVFFAGKPDPAAFLDVRGIGLSVGSHEKISEELSNLLKVELSIPPNRTYINFADVPANAWGFNSSTF